MHKQLKKLPSPPRKPSTLEPDFLQYYQSAVHPTLEETLSQKIRLPPVNLYGPQQCVDMDKLLTMPFDTCLALGWGAAPLFATGFAFYLQPHIYNVVFLSMLVPNLFMMGTMYKILVNEDVIFDKDNVNSYDHEKNTIRLTYGLWEETWTKEDLALTLVHELTHHYQHLNQWPDNDILMEGHARTVERKVADVLERSTGNEQWLRCPVQEELLELVPVYRKVCRKHDVVPKEYKLITPHSDIAAEDLVWDDPHCKGIALFRIAEHHKGQKVYDAVKKKNFDILVHHGA
ncbi:hypothetical protein HY639_04730 [Candidatus Woesearchaeota archaeon]|nr:hypothetical protein [Candidatus Woesearchaeota archaeon]